MGRFSDKFGRRPALLIALARAGVAYIVFGFAESLWVLFLSRIVQGAGGGTVGVIQAYVADTTEPEHRPGTWAGSRAATNLGVALGPVLGRLRSSSGGGPVAGRRRAAEGEAAPGIVAAALCLITILFAWKYLKESKTQHHQESERRRPPGGAPRVHALGEPASRLIWIYAIAIGAFQGTFPVLPLFLDDRPGDRSDDRLLLHVHRQHLGLCRA